MFSMPTSGYLRFAISISVSAQDRRGRCGDAGTYECLQMTERRQRMLGLVILERGLRGLVFPPEHCLVHHRVYRMYIYEVEVEEVSLYLHRRHLNRETFLWYELVLCRWPYPSHWECPMTWLVRLMRRLRFARHTISHLRFVRLYARFDTGGPNHWLIRGAEPS